MLTVVRIRNVAWVRTPHSLGHTWLWMFWRILGLSTQAIRWRKQYFEAKSSVLTIQITRSHNWEDHISIVILRIFHALSLFFFYKKTCPNVRWYIALLFYIILWSQQKCVAGNLMRNCKVYCLKSVCSCFVIILKFYIFSILSNSGGISVGMIWQEAALPMSCYIVRKTTTRSMPQSNDGYLRTSKSLWAL